MNDFDKGLIAGMAHNVVVERIVKDYFATRKFTMTMDCIVLDENEQEVSNVSTMYTKNMVNLRVFGVLTDIVGNYDNHYWGTFNALDGTEFTGYFQDTHGTSATSYALGILGYNPAVYLSSDGAEVSRNDYTLPEDAVSISWTTIDTTVYANNWTCSTIHTYFTNETDEDITVNKVLVTGYIGSSSNSNGYECLLFEELLDEPITIKAGERWARDYSFRVSI